MGRCPNPYPVYPVYPVFEHGSPVTVVTGTTPKGAAERTNIDQSALDTESDRNITSMGNLYREIVSNRRNESATVTIVAVPEVCSG